MKPIEQIKVLFECFRLRRENARLREMIRREQGEEKLKEIEEEVQKKREEIFSRKKKDD